MAGAALAPAEQSSLQRGTIMSPKQSFAIFTITGVDVRGCNIPQSMIDRVFAKEDLATVREELVELGGKPKRPLPAPRADFGAIWQEAVNAGKKAVEELHVIPMVVSAHSNPLDDSSPVEQSWYVADGACGFAWIWFKGNTSFGRWAKKEGLARSAYPNGLQIWISEYGQSIQKKEAFAQAAAAVLRSHDILAYAQSRLD